MISWSFNFHVNSRLIAPLLRYERGLRESEDKILSIRRAWVAVLKTKGVRRGSGYNELETGQWRCRRSSTKITRTGCNKFHSLAIFSNIETACSITSSIRDSSRLFWPIFVQQADSFSGGARRWWDRTIGASKIGSRADRARVDKKNLIHLI